MPVARLVLNEVLLTAKMDIFFELVIKYSLFLCFFCLEIVSLRRETFAVAAIAALSHDGLCGRWRQG